MLRANVNEVDVEVVDLGDELRQGVQLRLAFAPVVVARPVTCELLHRRQWDALRVIWDRLPVGPLRRHDAPAEVVQLLLRDLEVERADLGCDGAGHEDLVGAKKSVSIWVTRSGSS